MRFLILALGLFCAALSGSPATAAAAMKFSVITVPDCKKPSICRVLLAEGEIRDRSERSFRAAIRRSGPMPVLLHSPGGELRGGLLLGMAFRELGSNVGVAPGGACYSACAYALMGGVNRRVFEGGVLGVHEFYDPHRKAGKPLTAAEARERKEVQHLLVEYAKLMGVSPSLIGLALKTPQNNIHVLSSRELKKLRVVN